MYRNTRSNHPTLQHLKGNIILELSQPIEWSRSLLHADLCHNVYLDSLFQLQRLLANTYLHRSALAQEWPFLRRPTDEWRPPEDQKTHGSGSPARNHGREYAKVPRTSHWYRCSNPWTWINLAYPHNEENSSVLNLELDWKLMYDKLV